MVFDVERLEAYKNFPSGETWISALPAKLVSFGGIAADALNIF
jgi:hypothetical protein